MWQLIKKFSPVFLLYLGLYALIFFPLLNYSRFTQDEDPAELIYLLYQGAWGFWIILGAIWVHEQIESKRNSYGFLRTLPIRNRDIISAKFTLVLFSVFFFVCYQTGIVALLIRDADFSWTAWKYNLSIGNICLLMSGLFYLGIYRYGFIKFGKVILGSWLFFFLSPLLLREVIMKRFNLDTETWIAHVTSLNWWLTTLVVLVIYSGMLKLAIKLKNAEKG
jgi:hypothetical protein